jgi:hypothetical protein
LCARCPKADCAAFFGVLFFGEQFFGEDDDAVAVFVVAEADLTSAEERVNGRIDAHDFFHVIARGFFKFGFAG